MHILFLLVNFAWLDVANLSNDSFLIREQSNYRLSCLSEIALPALLWASHQKDIEQKWRAKRLLDKIYKRWYEVTLSSSAFYLFYGPSELTGKHRRFLGSSWTKFLSWLPKWIHYELFRKAYEWNLVNDFETPCVEKDFRCGWVNIVRHRAYGLPDPR